MTSCDTPAFKNSFSGSQLNPEEKKTELVEVTLDPEDYMLWVQAEEHGLRKQKKIGNFTFTAFYKPMEYIICKETGDALLSDSVIKTKTSELEGLQYYDFRISLENYPEELLKYNISSTAEYEQRVKYFSYEMNRDIKLVENQDTLPCVLYHFERTYGTAPFCTFNLGFVRKYENSLSNKTLVYYDRVFQQGIIKILFKSDDLGKIPKFKIR